MKTKRKRERERKGRESKKEIKRLVVLAEPSERASEDERRASSSRTNYLNSQLSAPSRRRRKDSRERDSHLLPFFSALLSPPLSPFTSFSPSRLTLFPISAPLRPSIRLYTFAHTCTGARRDFSFLPFFPCDFLPASPPPLRLPSFEAFTHRRRRRCPGVRVSFFRKLSQLQHGGGGGKIL